MSAVVSPQPGRDRVLASRATEDEPGTDGIEPRRGLEGRQTLVGRHDDDLGDLGRCREGLDGPAQQRASGQARVQLVLPAHALTGYPRPR